MKELNHLTTESNLPNTCYTETNVCNLSPYALKNQSSFLKRSLQKLTFSKVVYTLNNTKKTIALTFDDGPHFYNTDVITSILKEFNIHATFFFSGVEIERNFSIAKHVHSCGHIIGNHGFKHAQFTNTLKFLKNIFKAQQCIESITGHPSKKLFRPPYGKISFSALVVLILCGYTITFWDYDSLDSYVNDSKTLISIFHQKTPNPGSIILMHDDYMHTQDYLRDIIDTLIFEGYEFVLL